MKKQQSGFTLIELIMVIVILGILSAVALPKFTDLSSTAKQSAVEGALAAAKSANVIAHSSFLAKGGASVAGASSYAYGDNASSSSNSVTLVNGYLAAEDLCNLAGLDSATTLATAVSGKKDFACVVSSSTTSVLLTDGVAEGDACFKYTEAASANAAPSYTMSTLNASQACQ